MNCLCNLFDDPIIWLIIIALILLFMNCNNNTCNSGTNGFCGNSYNSGCGCGCGN